MANSQYYPSQATAFEDYNQAKMNNSKSNLLKNFRKSLLDRDMPRSMELGLRLEQSGDLKKVLFTIEKTLIESKFPEGIKYYKYVHELAEKTKEKGQSSLNGRKDLLDLLTVVVQLETNQLPLELAYMQLQETEYNWPNHSGPLKQLLWFALHIKQPRDRCNTEKDMEVVSYSQIFSSLLVKVDRRQLYPVENYLLRTCKCKELAVTYVYCMQFKEFMKDGSIGLTRHKVPPNCTSTHYLTFSNPDLIIFPYDKRRMNNVHGLRQYFNFTFDKETNTDRIALMNAFENHLHHRVKAGKISLHYITGFRSSLLNDVRQHWRRASAPPTVSSIETAFSQKVKSLRVQGNTWSCELENKDEYCIELPVLKKSPSKSSAFGSIKKLPSGKKYGVNQPRIAIIRCNEAKNDYVVTQVIPSKPMTFKELLEENAMDVLKLLTYRHVHKLDTRRKNMVRWKEKLWSLDEKNSKSKRDHFRDFEWEQLMVRSNRKQPLDTLFDRLEAFLTNQPNDFLNWVKKCNCSNLNHLVKRMAKKIPALDERQASI